MPTVVPLCPDPALPGSTYSTSVWMTPTSLSTRLFSLLTFVSAHRRHSSEGEGGCGDGECGESCVSDGDDSPC